MAKRGKARRRWTRGVKARAGVARLRRRADDAGIDERTIGRRDDGGDPIDRLRIDGVAIDIDRLGVAGLERRLEALGQRHRVARRQDRQDEIGRRDLLVACGRHAGGFRPRRRLGAAALERGEHLDAVIDEPFSDGCAHHARRDHCNDRSHIGLALRNEGHHTSLHSPRARRSPPRQLRRFRRFSAFWRGSAIAAAAPRRGRRRPADRYTL